MKQKLVIALISILSLTGCFDIFKSKEKKIVGKISVIDSNDEEGGRYKLILYNEQEKFNQNVLADYIINIVGNDSVLLVKAVVPDSCTDIFYKIIHSNGEKITRVFKLDVENYMTQKKILQSPSYKFNTDHVKCP